jgi:hypothetical protein
MPYQPGKASEYPENKKALLSPASIKSWNKALDKKILN